MPKAQINAFCDILEIPEFIVPWLDRFYEPEEIQLVLELNAQSHPDWGARIPEAKAPSAVRNWPADFLTRCHRRAVIYLDNHGKYAPESFHVRYEIWTLFEGWKDVPKIIQAELNRWELNYFIDTKTPEIEAFQSSEKRDLSVVWPEYVLLDEAVAIIERVAHVYLWPCNCRAMMRRCHKPDFVCLRFDNNRDLGWEISKEKAKEIVHASHQKGLMQSAELGINSDGSIAGAICNCCSDCCFPVQLGNQIHQEALYPLNRYRAYFNKENCSACGRCAKRCPFQAFRLSKRRSETKQGAERQIHYDSDLCRGCGLCSTTCPEEAIDMKPLDPSALSAITKIIDLD